MMQRTVLLAGAAVALLAAQAPANAAVINMPQSQTLSSVPATVTMGTATFSFTLDTASFAPAADVSTAGSGAVSTIFGGIADFEAGSPIDGTGLFTFASYPTATLIPNSQADDFIGLSYTGVGGTYYGYAEVSGNTLLGSAFEDTPNTTITTAPLSATAVPEPMSAALVAVGALTVGALRGRKRATKQAA
ncbi:MAG: hypothetical protein ACRYF2_03495 [Janthinobacterium lividum]